jgi:hypothetical protein
MADTEATKRVHKEIQDKVKPAANNAFKGIAKTVPELAKAMKKVDDAIKKGESADLLQTYRRELVIKLRAVSDARGWAIEALEALEKATADDDDFEADADEIEELKKKLTKAKELLADQIVKGKKLEDGARAAAEEGDKTEKTAHREWDTMMTLFERQTASLNNVLKRMREAQKAAEAAVKSRDAGALKTHQETVVHFPLNDDVLKGKLLLKRTHEFLSRYDLDSFSKAFVEEMAKDRATTVGEYDKHGQALEQEASKIQGDVAKLEIEPPDAVKATAVLGFKANFITKVQAALKLDEGKLAKALEDLARQAGVKATGKELVEKLKKAKLL